MKIDRKHMLEVLQAVKPGLASKEVIEQSTSFIFTDGRVMTYNDEIAISHPLDIDLEGAVIAKEFFNLLSKLHDEEVDVSTTKSELAVKGKKNKAGIKLELKTNIDEIIGVLGKVKKWNALPASFTQGLGFCLFSTGKDMTRALLTCIHCSGNSMMSSDDVRITLFEMGKKADMPAINIPATAAYELKSFEPIEYSTTKGWAHFKSKGGAVFSCRILEDAYAKEKIMSLVEKAIKGDSISLPNGLSDALERAGIFSTSMDIKTIVDNRVRVTLDEGTMTIRGEGNSGWFEETNRIRYKGDLVEFDINPTFLQSILPHTNEVILNQRTLCFQSDDFTHVILTLIPKKKK